jgi:hypothetical protein
MSVKETGAVEKIDASIQVPEVGQRGHEQSWNSTRL